MIFTEKQEFLKLYYPERVKWIDQQLKKGMGLEEIFDLGDKSNKLKEKVTQKLKSKTIDIDLPECAEGMMSSRVNSEVMRQWGDFTSSRKENAIDLFSMALWEFIQNHR